MRPIKGGIKLGIIWAYPEGQNRDVKHSRQVRSYLFRRCPKKNERRRQQKQANRQKREQQSNKQELGHGTSDGSRRGDLGTSGLVPGAKPSRCDFRPGYQLSQFCRLANTPWYKPSVYGFDGQDEEDDEEEEDDDDNSEDEESDEEDGFLVEEFMRNPLSVSRCEDQVDLLLSFCPEKTRQELEHGSLAVLSEKVCLLDDRSSDGTRWQTRACLQPLTVIELQSELSKERFIPEDLPAISDRNSDAGDNHPPNAQQRISADRRLIFITNLNCWGVMALITTASRIEADALRSSLYRHLSFQTYIGLCQNASMGFPFFRFALDLPFFVWRTTLPSQKPYDVREKRGGQSLREVRDLSFLNRQESTTNDSVGADSVEVDYLCQAHMSVVISIIDNRRWTAYGFIDTYFRANNEDSVEAYYSEACNGPIKPDPLTKGSRDADKPLLDPNAYAWAVMEARMEQVKGEWQSVVDKLQERVQSYINTCPSDTASFSSIISQQCLTWIRRTRKLLSDLTETIKLLIREWDSFDPSEFFPVDSVILTRMRSRIQECFRELGKCLDKLESLQRQCECYADNIDLYMSGAGHQDARRQTETAQSMHNLTNVMLYFVYPTTLAAALLSMQADAIPGLFGPTKLSFPVLATVLTILVFASLKLFNQWEHVRTFLFQGYEVVSKSHWSHLWANFREHRPHTEDIELGSSENQTQGI